MLHPRLAWMMQLPAALSHRFEQELGAFEEEMHMPYVTSVERIAEARGEARGRAKGHAEGRAEGRAEGAARVVQQILKRTFGRLPVGIGRRLRELSADDLEALAGASLEFKDLKDLRTWLDEHREG